MAITLAASDKSLWVGPAVEINSLHNKILEHARASLDDAIRIGEVLTQVKDALKHGEWLPWLAEFAGFSRQTSDNYVWCFDNREALRSLNVSNLSDAYSFKRLGFTESNGEPQQLHEPNFHSQAIRLEQNLVGLFTHYLQRRPLKSWHTEEIYDLLCSLKSVNDICTQLELELGTRNDLPSAYRQANAH